ncbi:MAG: hypothetical protein RIU71_1655 [Pseudomonadota bacterium]|jgi:hypothetical protein
MEEMKSHLGEMGTPNRNERNHTLNKWGQQMISFGRQAQSRAKTERAEQVIPALRLMTDDLNTMSNLDLIEALSERLIKAGQILAGLGDSMPAIKQGEQTKATERMKRSRTAQLAKAGAAGAKSKHTPTNELKKWAEREAVNMRGADRDKARILSARIPTQLANASKNPDRLIYDHLLAIGKRKREASQP